MVAYNSQEKAELNHMVALCREYRFHETRQNIVQTAGLPPEAARLSIPELRRAVEAQIAAKKAPALAGEMLRIESTRHQQLQSATNRRNHQSSGSHFSLPEQTKPLARLPQNGTDLSSKRTRTFLPQTEQAAQNHRQSPPAQPSD